MPYHHPNIDYGPLVASAPTNLRFEVGSDATSVILTWTPPSPLGDTTGYRISFIGGGSSGSVNVSGGDTNSYILNGLKSGETYEVSIVGTSEHFFSDSVEWNTITVICKWCWKLKVYLHKQRCRDGVMNKLS